MSHTPGPWHVDPDNDNPIPGPTVVGSDDWPVCSMMDFKGRDDINSLNQANASLIAAAPEMLDALEQLVGWGNEHGSGIAAFCGCDYEMLAARAAIAKAKGEA